MPMQEPSPYLPVKYYVDTDNYKTAEDVARVQLEAEHENHASYDQVVLAHIHPLKVTHHSTY